MAHAFERVDDFEIDGEIFATADLGEKEFVHRKIGIGKVEFDLGKKRKSVFGRVKEMGTTSPVFEFQQDRQSLLEPSDST
jgi:hypothetical protein